MLDLRAQLFEALGLEKSFTCARRGYRVYKHISVVDLKNLRMSHFSKDVRSVIKSIISLGSEFYPESLWKLYLINAPTIFRAIWSVLKPMVHPETLAKTFILGGQSDFLPVLLREGLPIESVPIVLGGKHAGISGAALCDDAIAFASAAAARYPAVPPRDRLRGAVHNLAPGTRTLAAAAAELQLAARAGPATRWEEPPVCELPDIPPPPPPPPQPPLHGSSRRISFEVPSMSDLRAVRPPLCACSSACVLLLMRLR